MLHSDNKLIMAGVDLMPLLGQLDDNVDDLEEALEPLLTAVLSTTMSKLPVLDKAKLYVLLTYTIESLLFCNLFPKCLSVPVEANLDQRISASTVSTPKNIRYSKN